MAEILSSKEFKDKITNGKGIAMVDFFAEWCGPCKQQLPIVDALSNELKDKVFIAKVNVDEESDLASEFEIASIPTLIFFKDGTVVNRVTGLHDKVQIDKILKKIK